MRGQKPGRGTKDEMKNSTEYLKGCKVPTVSETMSPNFLDREGKERKKHRTAWGNNDFKALIRENMKGFEGKSAGKRDYTERLLKMQKDNGKK